MQHEPSQHWDAAYSTGDRDRSWYQPHAEASIQRIESSGTTADAVIDIGGGASTLVDGLLDAGYRNITVLDVSDAGMQIARARLGQRADLVHWVVSDITGWQPENSFDVWHDRAVLHFLTTAAQQAAYREVLLRATTPGSRVVIGVFGPHGPQQCSGLDVRRYDADAMAQLLGPEFTITNRELRDHTTPSGAVQEFLWTTATRIGALTR